VVPHKPYRHQYRDEHEPESHLQKPRIGRANFAILAV
jgi:hypothetical protein